MPKHNFKPKKKEKSSGNTFAIIFLVVIVAAGGGIFYMTATKSHADTGNMNLPSYAYTTDQVTQAYVASAKMSDLFQYMPCYCGCAAMAHPVPHKNLRDCFHDENGVWNQHAAGCSTCDDISIILIAMLN